MKKGYWIWNPERKVLILPEVAAYNCVCKMQPREICAYHRKLRELIESDLHVNLSVFG